MTTRFTEEGQKQRSERLNVLRKRTETIKRLQQMKESPEWRDLKSILDDFIASEEQAIKMGVLACSVGGHYDWKEQAFVKDTNDILVSDIRVSVERKGAYQLIVDLVEKTDEQLSHLESTITGIENQYKEAKSQIG